jgi:hypothetical protein
MSLLAKHLRWFSLQCSWLTFWAFVLMMVLGVASIWVASFHIAWRIAALLMYLFTAVTWLLRYASDHIVGGNGGGASEPQ